MPFLKALKLMLQGKKVRRKKWLKDDWISIDKKQLICDGGFEFTSYLKNKDIVANDWVLYK